MSLSKTLSTYVFISSFQTVMRVMQHISQTILKKTKIYSWLSLNPKCSKPKFTLTMIPKTDQQRQTNKKILFKQVTCLPWLVLWNDVGIFNPISGLLIHISTKVLLWSHSFLWEHHMETLWEKISLRVFGPIEFHINKSYGNSTGLNFF